MTRRPGGGRLAYERGIRYSSLPAPSRHLALTIATWASVETGLIPERFQPSLSTLEQSTGLSHSAVLKHLKILEQEGWLVRGTGGGRSNRTQYVLAVPDGAQTGHEVTGSNGSPGDPFPGNRSPGDQETGHDVTSNRSPGDYKSPRSPSKSPPPTTGGGGGDDRQEQAAAFLENLPGRWGVGRATARKLAPLLLEAAVRQGWDLDAELTAKLAEDLGPVTRYAGALKYRIDDLPKKPTARTRASPPEAELPPWCEHRDCDPTDRYRTTEDAQGFRTTTPCRACHPDHAKDRAA